MKPNKVAVIALCLFPLLAGCSTTKTLIKYKTIKLAPPSVLLAPCVMPFDKPPATYGEAVERDVIWWQSMSECSYKIDQLRLYFNHP
ncbi:Rz1-like lysis system protein LysC [Motilimonas cestriensis]|uniref:Rz1-like lysis system protein LysC n=1 Tax=Motilimonas cestriensis TaxID=2742685 RepID=UPI003CFE4B89